MKCAQVIDPADRPDWDSLLEVFPERTVFHGRNWAQVLRGTYGHKAFYLAQFEGERLTGLLPVMEVSSWLTGRRGVSLPFADFCGALPAAGADEGLYQTAMTLGRQRRWKYLECRRFNGSWEGAAESLRFYEHVIDLTVGESRLFEGLESAMRRGVRKARQAGLKIEIGVKPSFVQAFYALHCRTRRRHGLPPQPFRFFEQIRHHLLQGGQGFVVLVSLRNQPVAAGIFFYGGRQAFYKFGASDFDAQQWRPNNLMMWAGMQQCAGAGMAVLNLGRTSMSNEGLRRFKLNLGAVEQLGQYARYDFAAKQFTKDVDRVEGWFNKLFGALPLPLLRLAGAALYPHLS